MKSLSRVRLFATPWTAAHQALRPWDSPGKSTGVGCHCLLQEYNSSSIKILCYLNKCQRAKLTYWKGTNFPFESYSRFHSILWERDFHNQATEKVWKQCGRVAWGWEREKKEGRRVRERRQWATLCRTEKHQTSNEDNLNVKRCDSQ